MAAVHTRRYRRQRGYTIVEAIVATAIATLLIGGLVIFVSRSFTVSREQFEQVRITEDARLELERMSDTLRNARYVDRNNNGFTNDTLEGWLLAGGKYDISVYSNIDADADAELVRYYVESTTPQELKRSATQFSGSSQVGQPTEVILSRNIYNLARFQALFTYYAPDGSLIPAPVSTANLSTVARVGLTLVVDASATQQPDAVVVSTDATPRSSICIAGTCQSAGTGCQAKPDITLGPFAYNNSQFIEDGGQACKTHCQTPGVTACCPWDASYTWDGANTVTGSCKCQEPVFPSSLPDSVNYGSYTQYYKNHWEFCQAQGQFGLVTCDPTCELQPNSSGQCTWDCQVPTSPTPTAATPPSPSPTPSGTGEVPTIVNYRLNGEGEPHVNPPNSSCPEHTHYISYTTINATNCTASGAWSGPQPLSSNGINVYGSGTRTYTLTCSGSGGEASVSAYVVQQVGASCY